MQDQYVINHYFDNEWRIIILNEDNEFTWEGYYSRDTDEGFESSHEKIWVSDGEIHFTVNDMGRDCDGYIAHSIGYKMNGFKKSKYGFDVPVWETSRPGLVYDQYAQAAGY
jgi:hypothetical protein